jgi:RNA polymerase sigma-70 factor (ECF subfamily)
MSGYKSHSDHELLKLLKADDHGAFTEIYVRYSAVVYRNAYKLLSDRAEGMDIVQEVFTSLWNKRADVLITTNLSGYLYVAARNSIFKTFAHQEVTSKYLHFLKPTVRESTSISDHLVREKQLQEIIEEEINELPSKMREVLNLSRKSYLTHKEIAVVLHISESTVKKQVNNALKILRVKLGTYLSLLLSLVFYNTLR